MKRLFIKMLVVGVLMLGTAQAKLSQPDYILYGTATWFGGPLATESEISIYLNNQLVTVATYQMGTDNNLNGLYALRVPMDSNDPREFGKARPGDPASIFINGSLVAEVLVGDYGVAERLDIDPINLADDVSVINIQAGEVAEGNAGETTLTMPVLLSATAEADVTVDWQNVDGTAIGGDACDFDVDYINGSGTATIPTGQSQTNISIQICGDTQIETSETFEIVISNAENGVIQFDRATGTILDDDGLPELRGFDAVVYEPDTGSVVYEFQLQLSRSYDQDVSVEFATTSNSAIEGGDYIGSSGTVQIPSGQLSTVIPVTFLSDSEGEGIEIMMVQLSNVSNATLVSTELTAFILDANQEEQTEEDDVVDSGDVPDLISPSDVLFSPNGDFVYVSTLNGGGSVMRFGFDDGQLSHLETINNQTAGFESGLFGLIRDLTLAPNGEHMFAAASGDQAIMSFTRNAVDGTLSLNQTVENELVEDFGINGVYGLALGPDGNYLYAVGSESDAISVFAVNPTDASLTFVEKEVQGVNDPDDAGATVTFMDRPVDVVLSPDGAQVFVAADFSSSLVVFDRDAGTGELSYRESFKSGIGGVSGLGGASSAWVSHDGAHVYVMGRGDDSIAIFERDQAQAVSFQGVMTQAQSDFIGLNGPAAVMGSHDDSRLYGLGFDDSSMVTFERNIITTDPEHGDLSFADIEQDNVNDVESMAGPIALDLSPDGQWLIVAAGIDNALVVFKTHLNDLIFRNGFQDD